MLTPVNTSSISGAPPKAQPFDLNSSCSFILTGANHEYYAEWAGHLSLKSFYNGGAYYNVGAGRYAVGEGDYLLLNEGQRYAITVDAASPVESFCLFFESKFAERVLTGMTGKAETLLENRDSASPAINIVQRLYTQNHALANLLGGLRQAIRRNCCEQGWAQEQLHGVMEQLLAAHTDVLKDMERLPSARASTREELYRRLYRARDYAAASFHEPLTLADLARVACLSPNHFLRTFKRLFRQTPHQYVTSLRLERAKRLLSGTDRSVTDICLEIGFESPGSFSWLFRRQFGISPAQYRRQKGDFQEAHR